MNTTPTKRCTKCGEDKPATREFFQVAPGAKDGFKSRCKVCLGVKKEREWHRPEIGEDGLYPCKECGTRYPRTEEFFYLGTNKKTLQSRCKGCVKRAVAISKGRDPDAPKLPRGPRPPRKPAEPKPLSVDKACRGCQQTFPRTLEHFPPQKKGARDGLKPRCRTCVSAAKAEWDAANKPRVLAELKAKYDAMGPVAIRLNNRKAAPVKKKSRRKVKSQWLFGHGVASQHNRRARKLGLPGRLTTAELRLQMEAQGFCCQYCRRGFTPVLWPELEHTVPVSREGSTNTAANVTWACRSCNQEKKDKLLSEWTFRWYEQHELWVRYNALLAQQEEAYAEDPEGYERLAC